MSTGPDDPASDPAGSPEAGAPAVTTLPGARFDPVTGVELGGRDGARRGSYALQQGEPVMSFNLVSSLLPLASGTSPQTYRWALALGLLVPIVAGALGYLAFAFVAAALVIPVVYTIYLYDVNQWDDQPVGVTLGTLGVAGALGVGFTWVWHGLLHDGSVTSTAGVGFAGIDWTGLLVLCLLVPIVSEVLKEVGPVFLACRPQFDDLIDALTFGVAAGSAFAAAETIVVNRALFSSFGQVDDANSGFWVSLVLSAALVKPIVYGAATGIALAAFSGVGRGYSGFKAPYARGLAEAIGANIVFQVAMFIASQVGGTSGAVLGLVLGVAVAVVLLLRLRYLLHIAVLEAALESASGGGELKDTAHGTAWCPSCDLPLVEGANFCVACGTAVRAASKVSRRRNAVPDEEATAAPATEPPRDHQRTALVVGAALAVVLAGGLIAQLAAAASSEVADPSDPGITLEPDLEGGSQIDPQPTPAPPPGPSIAPSASPSAAGAARSFVLAADSGGGVNLELAPGWTVLNSNESRVVAGRSGGSAIFTVDRVPPPADAALMIQSHLNGLVSDGVQNLEITQPKQVALPNADFVAAQQLNLRGMLATQQGGSFPVEGFAFYLVRRDGVGIVAAGLYAQGTIANTPEVVDEYASMLDSVVR